MSIALEAEVDALKRRLAELENKFLVGPTPSGMHIIEQLSRRLTQLEQTAARKPGPKPKESNG